MIKNNFTNVLGLILLLPLTNCGGSGSSTASSGCNPCIIYVSATTSTANLSGVSGADSICQNDANKPSSVGTAKALIVDGTNRVACTSANCSGGTSEHTDWVLQPSVAYTRSDSTYIATTTSAGIFSFNIPNPIYAPATNIWTGLSTDFTTAGDCTNWTNSAAVVDGEMGESDLADVSAIQIGTSFCHLTRALYCVEQ